MPTLLELASLAILNACVASDHGIIIKIETRGETDVNTPALRAKQTLYRFRKESGNPEYKNIQIRLSPDNPDTELWLLKQPDETPDQKVHVIDINDLD